MCDVQCDHAYDADRLDFNFIRYNADLSTYSIASWSLAWQWLGRCKDSHDCIEIGGDRLPIRLNHIHQIGGTIKMRLAPRPLWSLTKITAYSATAGERISSPGLNDMIHRIYMKTCPGEIYRDTSPRCFHRL